MSLRDALGEEWREIEGWPGHWVHWGGSGLGITRWDLYYTICWFRAKAAVTAEFEIDECCWKPLHYPNPLGTRFYSLQAAQKAVKEYIEQHGSFPSVQS